MSKLFSSRGRQAKPSPPYGKIALRVAISLTIAVLLLLNLFTYLLTVVNYYGEGMEPELHSGQVLVISRTAEVSEGDVIAFYYNNKVLVRRVVCSGGKQISIAEDGLVSINGQPLSEDYVSQPSLGQCNISFPFYVPADNFFVMGDDRLIAMDSRLSEIGTVPEDRIIGKVLFAI